MLRALRNQTQSIFFKCFLVLLICGFALWGVGDLTGGSKGKSILSVENQAISIEEALNEINRARYMLPDRPSLEDAIKNGMHRSVLKKLEQEILINEEANFLGLNVPLSEQMRLIREEKAFKDPLGKFSQNKFIQSLKNAGLSEDKYLDTIKTESNFKQLSMPIMNNDYYNEKVIKKIIDWNNEVRVIEYDIFKMVDEKKIKKPSNKVLKTFYENNKKSYELPLTRNIKFIEISPSDFEDQVKIQKKQIDEKYEIEKSNYITEETREILQITTQDKSKANKFVNLIREGKNFDKIAEHNFNLTTSDTNIGFLKKSELPSESADLIFKAKLNETLGPLKTKFGYSIYKIITIIPQKTAKYEDIIKNIKKKLIQEASVEILFEKLDEIEDLIAEGNNIDEIIKSGISNKKIFIKNLSKVSKKGLIYSYEKEISFLEKEPIFIKNVWNTDVNELSEIFNTNEDNYYLIEVINENKKEIPSFDLVKNKVYDQWLKNKIITKTKEKAKKIIFDKNNKLSTKASIRRDDINLGDLNNEFLINKIFDINNKDTKLLVSNNNLIAVRIKSSYTDNYKFDKKIYDELNLNFSKSFFNDFSNFYVQHLASKHKLIKNHQELENFFNQETIN